ncbi:hypothetical protein C8F04DRAFT_1078022, partial [Mycena alexandri]
LPPTMWWLAIRNTPALTLAHCPALEELHISSCYTLSDMVLMRLNSSDRWRSISSPVSSHSSRPVSTFLSPISPLSACSRHPGRDCPIILFSRLRSRRPPDHDGTKQILK